MWEDGEAEITDSARVVRIRSMCQLFSAKSVLGPGDTRQTSSIAYPPPCVWTRGRSDLRIIITEASAPLQELCLKKGQTFISIEFQRSDYLYSYSQHYSSSYLANTHRRSNPASFVNTPIPNKSKYPRLPRTASATALSALCRQA